MGATLISPSIQIFIASMNLTSSMYASAHTRAVLFERPKLKCAFYENVSAYDTKSILYLTGSYQFVFLGSVWI